MFQLNGLELGVATAAAQIEGGALDSNWNRYSDAGKIYDGSNIKRAADHWHRYREDVDLLEALEIKHYRMSVAWARLEPRPGQFDDEALARYRTEIALLRSKKIEVLLTLHHFSHPGWFDDLGGFTRAENAPYFLRFVEYVVRGLGDLVSDFCTINEPNVYAVNGFLFGEWLEEEHSLRKTLHVLDVFTLCHIQAYQAIHAIFKECGWGTPCVSFAHHIRVFHTEGHRPWDRLARRFFNFAFQKGLFSCMAQGRFRFPFHNLGHFPPGQYIDCIAINYYTRGMVRDFHDTVKKDSIKNDLGWEIYPPGILEACQMLYDLLPLDIMITENGTCDNADDFRPRYLYDHLKLLAESPLPIRRYYHWCFTDNFEWKEGELPRFGLVSVDYASQKRTIKTSGYFYRDIIRAGGVTPALYDQYVRPAHYHHGERNIFRGVLSEGQLSNKR